MVIVWLLLYWIKKNGFEVKYPFIYYSMIVLKDHQKPPIKFIKDNYGLLLYHSLGSGKTVTSLMAMAQFDREIIVIGPKSSKKTFNDNIIKLNMEEKDIKIYTFQKIKVILETNFDIFINKCVIVDEAHHLRNETKDNMVLIGALGQSFRIMLCTATPIINYLNDIAPLINIVKNNNALPTERELFNFLYFNERDLEIKNENIMRNKLSNCISYYRSENSEDYPRSSEIYKRVVMAKEQMAEYSKYIIRILYADEIPDNKDLFDIDFDMLKTRKRNSFLTATRQISNIVEDQKRSTKVDEIMKIVNKGPYPIVIYSNFLKNGIYAVAEKLSGDNFEYGMITGNTASDKLDLVINKYNNGDYKVLLLSTAGSESLDLKNTRQIHIMEPHWNEPKINQVIGRAIRYKSHSSLPVIDRHVSIFRWISVLPDKYGNISADEYLMKIGKKKDNIFRKFNKILIDSSIENNKNKVGGYLKQYHKYLKKYKMFK